MTSTEKPATKLAVHADEPTVEAVRAALQRVVQTERFVGAPRVRDFLEFVVEETLQGRQGTLKAYTIAIEGFRYPTDFDPRTDPYVRIVAGRVRRTLTAHYQDEGCHDPVRITIPKGSYVPQFERASIDEIVEATGGEPTGTPRIAIMHFEHVGDSAEQVWLATGLTAALVANLARFEEVRVMGPLSANAPGTDVEFQVSGVVQTQGEDVRVSVQLMDHDGHTVWARHYDHDLAMEQPFAIQDDVTRRVAGAIAGSDGAITRSLSHDLRHTSPRESSAYVAVLKAFHWATVMTDAAFHDACEALHGAIERTPDYALARSLLSDMYFSDWLSGIGHLDGGLDEAEKLAREAVDLDPQSAESRWSLAQVHFGRRRDQLMMGEYELALKLCPHRTATLASYAMFLVGLGETSRAAEMQARAIDLNPDHPAWYHYAGFMLAAVNDEWQAALGQAACLNTPGLIWGPLTRAVASARLGRHERAADEVEALLQMQPDFAARGLPVLGRMLYSEANVALIVDGLRLAGFEFAAAASA